MTRQEIVRDGAIVGWRVYAEGGIFGALRFVGYEWANTTGGNDVSTAEQIKATTEARRHNGQCAYGPWIGLDDEAMPEHVAEAIADEVAEAMSRDMRREPATLNTDDSGKVDVGGEVWIYRR